MSKATSTSGALFRKVVPYKNVMTPDLIGYYENGIYDMELTKGRGINGEEIFGVTVVNNITREHEHELSQMFHARNEAINYMNTGVLK